MKDSNNPIVDQESHHWWLSLLLDVIEPVAPFVSQMLWVAQPMARIVGWDQQVAQLADTLDAPQGVDILRKKWISDTDQEPESRNSR